MSQESVGTTERPEALPCSSIVYRAILKKRWMDLTEGKATPEAFFRRPHVDEDGLSVNIAEATNLEEWVRSFNACYGVASLHVGRIRNLGLEVTPDNPAHAVITGVPFRHENEAEAEFIAGELAKQSRLPWPPSDRPKP